MITMMLPSLSFKIRPEDAVAISIKNVCRVFLVDLRGNSCIATRCVSRSASAAARGMSRTLEDISDAPSGQELDGAGCGSRSSCQKQVVFM